MSARFAWLAVILLSGCVYGWRPLTWGAEVREHAPLVRAGHHHVLRPIRVVRREGSPLVLPVGADFTLSADEEAPHGVVDPRDVRWIEARILDPGLTFLNALFWTVLALASAGVSAFATWVFTYPGYG